MKCPKCQYFSFDSGDRCRNCGYDFSLALDLPPADHPRARASAPSDAEGTGSGSGTLWAPWPAVTCDRLHGKTPDERAIITSTPAVSPIASTRSSVAALKPRAVGVPAE